MATRRAAGLLAALALALLAAACGRLGEDTAAVMAAHHVVERELGVKRVEFNGTRVLEKQPPWFLLETEVEIETAAVAQPLSRPRHHAEGPQRLGHARRLVTAPRRALRAPGAFDPRPDPLLALAPSLP